MEIKAIDISGGGTSIQHTDGTVEQYQVDGYAAMQRCRAADPTWNIGAASGRAEHVDAFVAMIKAMA